MLIRSKNLELEVGNRGAFIRIGSLQGDCSTRCGVFEFSAWILGIERIEFPNEVNFEVWVGPFYIVISKAKLL